MTTRGAEMLRALGRELGMARRMVGIPGEITEERLEILRKASAVYLDEIRRAGLYDARLGP